MRETDRIIDAYARRALAARDERYSPQDPANAFLFATRERDLAGLLRRHALMPLAGRRILDAGCGSGGVLRDLVRLGADARLCAGIDLLPDRVASARDGTPEMGIAAGTAAALPYRDGSFDIALQFTLMSSVLDPAMRQAIAAETLRVLRPAGVLVWYDFLWNPGNPDVRGIRLGELRALYPGCRVDAQRVTLAPPLLRLAARVSTRLCRALDAVPAFRSHYLAAVWTPVKAAL
jgi:SAM-dependent methyltransferase